MKCNLSSDISTTLVRVLTGTLAILMINTASIAHADSVDDHIAQACAGLSQDFYANSKIIKSDQEEIKIFQKIFFDEEVANLLTRAHITGAAHACGALTADALANLEAQAQEKFSENPALSKRFVQVIDCKEAEFERLGLYSRWAASQPRCPQVKKNFDFYVQSGHPFTATAPQVPFAEDLRFNEACKNNGVTILAAPAKKINTIYANWDADQGKHVGPRTKYIVDSAGRLSRSYGGMPVIDGISNSPQADVIVAMEISDPEETTKALVR
jgi:hypothetical protein